MLTLVFETANFGASMALFQKDCCLAYEVYTNPHGQAAYLIDALKSLCEKSGYHLKDVAMFVTTTGPGSFTGVRLGLATAKTLAFASKAVVLGVSSFEWVAFDYIHKQEVSLNAPFLVALDARREEVFAQLFSPQGKAVEEPLCASVQDVLIKYPQTMHVIGNGAGAFSPSIKSTDFHPSVQGLALLGQRILEKKLSKHYPLTPLYLRPPDISTPKK